MSSHDEFMRRAIEIAKGNPTAPFGTVIVDRRNGRVFAEGLNRAEQNPIWHGEMDALRKLDPALDRTQMTLYTTAEPCPMCQAAILWSKIDEVVYGTSIETLIGLGWPQIVLRATEVAQRANFVACDLVGGVLEAECDALFRAAPPPG